MHLHLCLGACVHDDAVDPLGRLQRCATQQKLVVVQRVFVVVLAVLHLDRHEPVKAIQEVIWVIAVDVPINC